MRRLWILVGIAILGASAAAQAALAAASPIAESRDWLAYRFHDRISNRAACSADTMSLDDGGALRAEVFYPLDHSYDGGYLRFAVRPQTFVGAELYIDGVRFPMYMMGGGGRLAVIEDRLDGAALRAMRRGYEMVLVLHGRRGRQSRFRFSLLGFTAMYRFIAEECGFDPTPVVGAPAPVIAAAPAAEATPGAPTLDAPGAVRAPDGSRVAFINGQSTDAWRESAGGDGAMHIELRGDGDANLDLYAFDDLGNLLCESVAEGGVETCDVTGVGAGDVEIMVINTGQSGVGYTLVIE